jgi:hypothetical protein
MIKSDQNAFTGFEMADVASELPRRFELGLDHLDPSALDQLDYLASSFLEEIKAARTKKEKKAILMEVLSYAIYTGMLIREQRLTVDMIMYRNNTGLDN